MPDAIDLKDLMDRVQDDKELLLEILDIFAEDFVAKRQGLEESLRAKNTEGVKSIAHSIKGASGNISAKSMYANALAIEQHAKSGNWEAIAQALVLLDSQFVAIKENIIKIKNELAS